MCLNVSFFPMCLRTLRGWSHRRRKVWGSCEPDKGMDCSSKIWDILPPQGFKCMFQKLKYYSWHAFKCTRLNQAINGQKYDQMIPNGVRHYTRNSSCPCCKTVKNYQLKVKSVQNLYKSLLWTQTPELSWGMLLLDKWSSKHRSFRSQETWRSCDFLKMYTAVAEALKIHVANGNWWFQSVKAYNTIYN